MGKSTIAIENHRFLIGIIKPSSNDFHSYVSLPEGIQYSLIL